MHIAVPDDGSGRQNGYTTFVPHFMLRKCSYDASSAECRDSCIHHGRYCAVDSISDTFSAKFKPRQVRSAAWVHLGMQQHLPALLECACQNRA